VEPLTCEADVVGFARHRLSEPKESSALLGGPSTYSTRTQPCQASQNRIHKEKRREKERA
jgi:hypothetical protein